MAIGANMTQREQALVGVGVVAILLAFAFWWFRFSPQADRIVALSAHVDTVETNNRRARVAIARGTVNQLETEAAGYQKNLDMMRELVPTSNEVPSLLANVSTAARRVGLDLATVEPVPVIQGEQFDTYRYKVSVLGGYHEVAQFLSNVGSLDRIMAPVGLDLKVHVGDKDKSHQKAGASLLDASFQLQTYVARTTPLMLSKETK
ncbi:MAG: type 4a pilus biogenesis protein PilO [Gemmatimonadota bacterium]|nr:type 4a pilus biogenesis protein PilO [Gemmatimonadota bacterium]